MRRVSPHVTFSAYPSGPSTTHHDRMPHWHTVSHVQPATCPARPMSTRQPPTMRETPPSTLAAPTTAYDCREITTPRNANRRTTASTARPTSRPPLLPTCSVNVQTFGYHVSNGQDVHGNKGNMA